MELGTTEIMDRDQGPPPLPSGEPAWITYLQAAGTVLPALTIWIFSNTWSLPKLEWLWQHTNLPGSKAHWLLDASRLFAQSPRFTIPGVVILLVLVERCFPAWPSYRRGVVAVLTVFFHTVVLLGLLTISVSVLLAAPLLVRTK